MGNLNILFAGDFSPCRGFEALTIKKGNGIFNDALESIEQADISFVNLECPLTISEDKISKSGPNLKASPECIEALKKFDLVGLANNHILDYGLSGLKETIEVCERNNLSIVGSSIDQQGYAKPFIVDKKGVKVAILAFSEHEYNQFEDYGFGSNPIDLIENTKQIIQLKEEVDIIIVTLHAGNEYFPYPRPGLRKLCQYYVDIGANAVICHHAHVPGAYELYNEAPIVYSLGNLIFDNKNSPEGWDEGFFAKLEVSVAEEKKVKFSMLPYKQSVAYGGVLLLQGDEKKDFINKIDKYHDILNDDALWQEQWKRFVEKKADELIVRNYMPLQFRGLHFLTRKLPISGLFINKSTVMDKLNLVRCQSHQELLCNILRLKSQ